MQALYNFLETWGDQGIDEFRLETRKVPGGSYVLRISPVGREINSNTSVQFVVTRMGISPMDNRRLYAG
jgi:hypothetical protein